MKAVNVISGTGLPLKRSDVDTDQIIPAEWLKRVERTGFEKGLFATWRDDRDFVLNDERYAGASIIVAGPAFGVGSSREHAVWAILQAGFDAVDRAELLGHLPQQLHEERPRAGRRLRGRRAADLGRHRRRAGRRRSPSTSSASLVEVPTIGLEEPFPIDAATQERYLERPRRRRHHDAPRRRDRRLRGDAPGLADARPT